MSHLATFAQLLRRILDMPKKEPALLTVFLPKSKLRKSDLHVTKMTEKLVK
jgi:hypothetical protein